MDHSLLRDADYVYLKHWITVKGCFTLPRATHYLGLGGQFVSPHSLFVFKLNICNHTLKTTHNTSLVSFTLRLLFASNQRVSGFEVSVVLSYS